MHGRVLSKDEMQKSNGLCAARSQPSNPHLPPVECKIENADKYACNRQNSRGGKQFGRPRRIVSQDELKRLRSEGASLREISAKLGIDYGTVRLRLAQSGELITPSKGKAASH